MPWSNITAADVEAHLNAGELDDYRRHAAQIEDPLPTIIEDVTHLVRGYVAVRYRTQDGGIPDALRIATIDLVIHRLASRVHRGGGETDANRRQGADKAMAMLEDVATGDLVLDGVTPLGSGRWGSDERFSARA